MFDEYDFPPETSERKPTTVPTQAADFATPDAAGEAVIDLTQTDSEDDEQASGNETSIAETVSSDSLRPVLTQPATVVSETSPVTSPVTSPFVSPNPGPSRVESRPPSPTPSGPSLAALPGGGRRLPSALDDQHYNVAFYSRDGKRPRSNSVALRTDRFVRALATAPRPLAGTGAVVPRAPPSAVADASAALTPTGRKRRAYPVNFHLDVPSTPRETAYDGYASPQLRNIDTALAASTRALMAQRGLTEGTRFDYEKKVSHSWDPFCKLIECDRLFPREEDVLMWIVYLHTAGTRSHASVVQYVLARRRLQLEFDAEGVRHDNVFNSPRVRELMKTCRGRLRLNPANGDVEDHIITRAPLPPTDVRAIAHTTQEILDKAYNALASHEGSAAGVDRDALLQIRDGLAVCIGYTFGFRAGHLYELEFRDVDFGQATSDRPTNVAWSSLPTIAECSVDGQVANYLRVSAHRSKNAAPLEVRRDGGRIMRSSEWMRRLATMIARWRCVRRWWHAIRVECVELERTGEVVTLQTPIFSAPTAAAWSEIISSLRDELMDNDRILCMPFEQPGATENAFAAVQSMLVRSLAAAGCPAKPDGPRKYTSHSIRAGGASSCWLVTRALPIVRWWFRWASGSTTPEECYLAFDWNQFHHVYEADAIYFFGWLAAFDFDTPHLMQQLMQRSS